MHISRRTAIASLLASSVFRRRAWASSPGTVMIVTASAAGPHAAAVESMRRAFMERSIATTRFQLPAEDPALRQSLKNNTQLAIAVGIDALRALAVAKAQIPLLATMSFRTDLKSSGILETPGIRLASAIWLDLPVPQIIAGLRAVFPDARRIAVVRNPLHSEPAELYGQAHQLPSGATVQVVDCSGPADLQPMMRRLRGQVDVIICLPDSSLYNKTTVESLILASLEHRLPLVGFSANFVRAGAAVGVYPDFVDIGQQTTALAERCLSGAPGVHAEFPRRTTVAANERVLHLLGRDYREHENGGVVVIR
jgi:putative ABC transport system substrate-binding protein